MLDLNRCTIVESVPAELASTVMAIEEGLALVHVLEGGVGKVKPAAGTSGEFFRGIAHGNAGRALNMKRVDTVTVPSGSPYTVTLPRAPIGDVLVAVRAAGANARIVLAKAGAASTTEYAISGSTITFHSSFASRVVDITSTVAMTAAESAQMPYGGYNAFSSNDLSVHSSIGLITTGEVMIDNYDPTSDWAGWTGGNIKLGANGIFTLSGSGVDIDNIAVTKAPVAGDGWLGLYLNAR